MRTHKVISAKIIRHGEYCSVGDNVDHHGCTHTMTFDPDCIAISSSKGEEELCGILFDISPELIKELKAFVDILAISQEIQDSADD